MNDKPKRKPGTKKGQPRGNSKVQRVAKGGKIKMLKKERLALIKPFKKKLTAAFKDLRKNGFLALENFLDCRNCAKHAADVMAGDLADQGTFVKGVVFYDGQDHDALLSGQDFMYLKYGALDTEKHGRIGLSYEEVAMHVVNALQKHGLTPDWNGSTDTGILVTVEPGGQEVTDRTNLAVKHALDSLRDRTDDPDVSTSGDGNGQPAGVDIVRKVIQIVPATEWDAVCWYPGSPLIRVPMNGWALVEEIRPRMSLIVGISGEGQLWDEQPECIGYAHHSEPMEQLIARLGRSTSRKNGLPLVDQITSVRLVRLAGMLSNGDYSTFKGTPWVEAASPDMIVDKVNNIDLPDEARHIVAILPATNANAIYAFGPDLHVKRPLSVWALFREADGNGIEGWDAEHFLCNEWTNHLGYDTEPPRPEEFQWGD